MNLKEKLQYFTERLKCRVCFHDFTGALLPLLGDIIALHHANPLCEAMRGNPETYQKCLDCDTSKIADRVKTEGPFLKICHAGYPEFVFPLRKGSVVLGVMFVGFFDLYDESSGFPTRNDLLFFGELFASHIVQEIKLIPGERLSDNREMLIRLWFTLNFRDCFCSLQGLAGFLSISSSRTTQLLREICKKPFPILLRQYRIDCARKILANSDIPASKVALLAGFRNVNSFYRAFASCTGMTPLAWKQAHAHDGQGSP